jgi:hypothetical protein
MSWDQHDYAERLKGAFASVALAEVTSPLAKEVKAEGAERMSAALQGKTWSDVGPDLAMRAAPDLITLTTEAFVAYLPAFLRGAAYDLGGEGATYVFYALAPLDQLDAFYERTCLLFSPQQADLIAELLEQMAAEPAFSYFGDEPSTSIALWRRRASG